MWGEVEIDCLDLFKFISYQLHVFPYLFFQVGVAQESGGMEGGHQFYAVIIDESASQLAYRRGCGKHSLAA